ncbi:NUDIX hydrolase [Saccharomonospora sp.]|uniref:NUDIX hydrolase n=1 Tax=Saccharomonospora sp. TaxID=33913 RepID=UPI0026043092|nr:NUDIX hydrolase [Saccharomonospora sp.]
MVPTLASVQKEPPSQPVVAKDSATVVLVRDVGDRSGVEVFLQRRVRSMAFAAGMTVFPGGGVDQRDADASIGWVGPPPEEWARRFSCSEPLARALVCAVVREAFEESGVLLAGTESSVVADTGVYADARAALTSGELSLASFLNDAGLVVRADLLRPWANWVTPEEEPRRYDARFFVAALPEGQTADDGTTEVESAHWQRPEDAMADAEAGWVGLMPPTWCTLNEIAQFSSVAEVLACEREIHRIMPRFVQDGERVVVKLS